MTLLELKTQIALYCGKDSAADLTVGGVDLGLIAINQVRQQAEMTHDFEFQRKLLTVSVSSVTGGSLNEATVWGGTQEFEIKTIVDVGLFSDNNNLIPVDWRTVSASLELQRKDNQYGQSLNRYPTDAEVYPFSLCGHARVTFAGDDIFVWPKTDVSGAKTYQLGIEAYCFSPDYVPAQLAPILQVTGTLNPNATGVYVSSTLLFGGQSVYFRDDMAFTIFYSSALSTWFMAVNQGVVGGSARSWLISPDSINVVGNYTPQTSATGIATVIANYPIASDVWLTKGSQYLLWASVVHLNNLHKGFVFRQEGNLPPPQDAADKALQAFMDFDLFKYEQNRRHGI